MVKYCIWLTKCVQRVVINSHECSFAEVQQSGVPQETVLGSLLLLLYIDDINSGVSSKLRLFADDCILYHTINSPNDNLNLQSDLDLIIKWTQTWQIGLNINKCAILTCSKLLLPSMATWVYTIDDCPITTVVTQHPYLGVMFDSTMSFHPISTIL